MEKLFKIYKVIAMVVVAITVVLLVNPSTRNYAALIVLIPLGAIVGPFLALAFPFSVGTKMFYILGLIFSLFLIGIGIRKRKEVSGHLFVIIGSILWIVLGFLGLGTAT
jgi:hypothetical protein